MARRNPSRASRHICVVTILLLAWTGCWSVAEEFRDAENETSVILLKSEFDDDTDVANDNNPDGNRRVKLEHVADLSGDIDPNVERFVPRREWQEIKQGQAIPPGLHVRINFQTRKREAKILEKEETTSTSDSGKQVTETETTDDVKEQTDKSEAKMPKVVHHEPVEVDEDDGKIYFSKSQLKHALKDFRDKFHNDGEPVQELSAEDAPVPEKKFRSMEEIRNDLEHLMGHAMKSDVDVMRSDIAIITEDLSTASDKALALDNLENYVHQLDNGVDLEKIGGLIIIVNLLNNSDATLQEKAARVLGSACQSNPFVQSKAVEHGAVDYLVRIIFSADNSPRLKKSTLFALSALVRGHSAAQAEFAKLDGIAHILTLLKDDQQTTPIRIKAMNLIADLVSEQRDIAKDIASKTNQATTTTSLETALVRHGWCSALPDFLLGEDKDIIEKTLQAMTASVDACRQAFQQDNATAKLKNLTWRLKQEISHESDKDHAKYLEELTEQVNSVVDLIAN